MLSLVSEGRGNRDIAAELFISAKTASVHVSNILAKLHAASRTEAAAIAYRAGLADDAPERLAPESPRGCQPLRPHIGCLRNRPPTTAHT